MKKIEIYSDGSSKGNPGPARIGVIIKEGNKIIEKISRSIGWATNNQAEYEALILGLERAKKLKPQQLTCYLDSQLVVKQINREYKIKDKKMASLFIKVWNLSQNFKKIKFVHINREKNKEADYLSKMNEAPKQSPGT